jgi:DNA-binding NarL/FixJ family response regulator
MSERIDIVLVDDHRLFREGLARLLASDKRFAVVAQAASGEEFLAAIEATTTERSAVQPESPDTPDSPDTSDTPPPVVFMDIDMPGMGGAEASRRALERHPDLKIIALSMHGEQEFYLPMLEAGVKGFLLKNSDFGEVTAAAEAVAGGGTYFSQELMSSLVAAMSCHPENGGNNHADNPTGEEPLSDREAEVLPLVCEGLSNRQIADRLFISKRTVDKHRANILAKTGCKNTASLVVYAVKHNLVTL